MTRAGRIAGLVLPSLALVLAATLYFHELLPLPYPTRYLGSDFATYFYPVFRYVAEEVGAGRLPHWTPYVGVGYPLLSDIEASVFYPPVRLFTAIVGPPSYLALELYTIAHYVVAGLGMFALGRWIGLSALAAGTGALGYMLCGFLWAHAAHLTIIQSAAWLPWLLAAQARALARRSPASAVAAGALFALVALGGHPQIAVYAGLALALQGAIALVEAWPGAPWRVRVAPPVITTSVLALGVALAAPQLAPTRALAAATSRWYPSADFLAHGALTPDQFLTFLVPLAYLGTERFHSVDESHAYVGIGVLVLAAAGVILRRDAWSRFFALLVVLGLALAVVPLVPFYAAVAPHLPLVGLFRASARATLLADLGATGLAALGLDAWSRALAVGDARGRVGAVAWAWRGGLALAVAGGVPVALGRLPGWLGPLSPQFPEFYASFVGMLAAHVAVLEAWRLGWIRPALGAVATVMLVLVNLNSPYRSIAWALSPPEVAWQRTDIVRNLRTEPGHARVWNEGWLHRRGPRFEANTGLLHRVEVVSHETSLSTARFDDFSRAIGDVWQNPALVDLLNIRHLVVFEGDPRPSRYGRYTPPRLEAGDERRYDLRGFLDGAVASLKVVAEPEAMALPSDRLSVNVTAGARLEVCLGCPPDRAGALASVDVDGRTLIASATLAPGHPARHVRLRNQLPFTVSVQELRLDEIDLYASGGRYRQIGPNLWENGGALPRAFLVEEVLVLPDTGRIVPTLLASDPRRVAIVEVPPACQGSLRPSEALPPEVEIVAYEPARVHLRTRHIRPAFLVLTDAHYKEWRAGVDGRRARVHYVDLLFRGVCVPAGEHDVEFRYHPFALERGTVIAALAALAALGAVMGPPRWRSWRLRSRG